MGLMYLHSKLNIFLTMNLSATDCAGLCSARTSKHTWIPSTSIVTTPTACCYCCSLQRCTVFPSLHFHCCCCFIFPTPNPSTNAHFLEQMSKYIRSSFRSFCFSTNVSNYFDWCVPFKFIAFIVQQRFYFLLEFWNQIAQNSIERNYWVLMCPSPTFFSFRLRISISLYIHSNKNSTFYSRCTRTHMCDCVSVPICLYILMVCSWIYLNGMAHWTHEICSLFIKMVD